MNKQIKLYLALALSVIFFGTSIGLSSALACSSMGPGKHFGLVMTVDPAMGTFTIIDAETRQPIDFVASPELLKMIQTDDTIITTYEKEEGRLVAKGIVIQTATRG